MGDRLRRPSLPVWLVAMTTCAASAVPAPSVNAADEFRLRAEAAVAIEKGPIIVRVELTYDGEEPIDYLEFCSDRTSHFFVRPANHDSIPSAGIPAAGEPLPRAWPVRLRKGESRISYVLLRRHRDILSPGAHEVVIDWPVYVLKRTEPESLVIPRIPFGVVARKDGSRDLTFRDLGLVELEIRTRFRKTLSVDIRRATSQATNALYAELVRRTGSTDAEVHDDGLVDAVLRYDDLPAFDGLRARLLGREEFAADGGYASQLLAHCALEPKQLDQVFANLDLDSVYTVAAILGEKTLPPYFSAVFQARMLDAQSVWTRAMFLARFPDQCPPAWRRRLATALATCDQPLTVDEVALPVRALDSGRYHIREETRRELLALGPRVVRALSETLRKGGLSAEQAETIQKLIIKVKKSYPIGGPRVVAFPGLYEYGRHAFVGVAIPDRLRPVQKALDRICSEPESAGTMEVLQALAQNGPDSLLGVEATHLLKGSTGKR